MQNKNKWEKKKDLDLWPKPRRQEDLGRFPQQRKSNEWEHKVLQNCQLFKAELVKMNWKVSRGCLFALLFIMATALYKLPYTIVFAFTLIYLAFLDRFCQNCLNNNLMCCMQIFPHLLSAQTRTQLSSLTAHCTGIHYTVSLHERGHWFQAEEAWLSPKTSRDPGN